MPDFSDMLSKAREMQEKMKEAQDLIKKLSLFINDSDENIKSKKIIAKKKSKKYTKYQHYLIFNKILSNE